MTLNLMEFSGNDELFSAVLLGGQMKGNRISFDPSWQANAWNLDHPYGSDIFNRQWHPAVFISQGVGRWSVLDVKLTQSTGHGSLKNFMSYRINEPENGK